MCNSTAQSGFEHQILARSFGDPLAFKKESRTCCLSSRLDLPWSIISSASNHFAWNFSLAFLALDLGCKAWPFDNDDTTRKSRFSHSERAMTFIMPRVAFLQSATPTSRPFGPGPWKWFYLNSPNPLEGEKFL